MELTTAQIAALCGKSERQVQRWISKGTLPAQKIRGNRYNVAESELERLTEQNSYSAMQEQITALTSRIETVEQEMSDHRLLADHGSTDYAVINSLERRLDGFEDRLSTLEQAIERLTSFVSQKRTHMLKPSETHYSASEAKQEIASSGNDELESLAHFAKRHNVAPSTYKRWAEKSKLEKGPGGKYFVNEAVAAAFYQRFHQSTGFQNRECCPHPS